MPTHSPRRYEQCCDTNKISGYINQFVRIASFLTVKNCWTPVALFPYCQLSLNVSYKGVTREISCFICFANFTALLSFFIRLKRFHVVLIMFLLSHIFVSIAYSLCLRKNTTDFHLRTIRVKICNT